MSFICRLNRFTRPMIYVIKHSFRVPLGSQSKQLISSTRLCVSSFNCYSLPFCLHCKNMSLKSKKHRVFKNHRLAAYSMSKFTPHMWSKYKSAANHLFLESLYLCCQLHLVSHYRGLANAHHYSVASIHDTLSYLTENIVFMLLLIHFIHL